MFRAVLVVALLAISAATAAAQDTITGSLDGRIVDSAHE